MQGFSLFKNEAKDLYYILNELRLETASTTQIHTKYSVMCNYNNTITQCMRQIKKYGCPNSIFCYKWGSKSNTFVRGGGWMGKL